MEQISVPLNKLALSPKNVRKGGYHDVEGLAASIKAVGLVHQLAVEKAKGGTYQVVAGGRRLAALQELRKKKQVKATDKINCVVVPEGNATAVSLAENIAREPMHAADQFEAFKTLVDEGCSIADVASDFMVSETVVKKRLRLANLHPVVMAAFRADEIGLEEAMAYTLTEDQDRQKAVFSSNPTMRAHMIRRALTEGEVPTSDKRVRFVGLDAYRTAGGAFREDLFARDGNDSGYVIDIELLGQLVTEKLETELEAVRAEGWQNVVFTESDYNYGIYDEFPGRVYPKVRELTAEQEAHLDNLTDLHDELAEKVEADPDNEELLEGYEAVSRDIDAMRVEEFTAEDKARASAALYICHEGKLKVLRGLLSKEQQKRQKSGSEAGTTANAPSAAVVADMGLIRSSIVGSELAQSPRIALAALFCQMANTMIYRGYAALCDVRANHTLAPKLEQLDLALKPRTTLTDQLEALCAKLPDDPKDLMVYCLSLTIEQLAEHLAVLTAHSFGPGPGSNCDRPDADQLASAMETSPSAHVSLAEINYVERLTKQQILALLAEHTEANTADHGKLAKLKKRELVDRAIHLLDGKWLPPELHSFVPAKS